MRTSETTELFSCFILNVHCQNQLIFSEFQCLGSGFGSVGSASLWLPGSGYSKIFRSTDPDPKGKILINNWKKNVLLLKPKSELLKKVGLIKKIWKLFFIKKLSKSLRNDLDPDPDFTVWILRSGSGFASKLNGSLALGKDYPSYPPPPPVMT